MDLVSGATGALELVARVVNKAKNNVLDQTRLNDQSLISVSQPARVEPICLIDMALANMDELPDLTQVLQNIFAGYYLQAVNMLATVNGATIAQKLAPLSPNSAQPISLESFAIKPAREAFKYKLPRGAHAIALEADDAGGNALSVIKEASTLSVGKIFNVTLSTGKDGEAGKSIVVPISIRLLANLIASPKLVSLLGHTDQFTMSLKERVHGWKAGRLGFFKDLLLCNDLIDRRIKAGIKLSDDHASQAVLNREAKIVKDAVTHGSKSVGLNSNLVIISSDTMETLELSLGGKFGNNKIRDTVFQNGNLMILAVVDREWSRVTFYHRGIELSSSCSFKELKVSAKGGDNVTDIMKAFLAGSAPNVAY